MRHIRCEDYVEKREHAGKRHICNKVCGNIWELCIMHEAAYDL